MALQYRSMRNFLIRAVVKQRPAPITQACTKKSHKRVLRSSLIYRRTFSSKSIRATAPEEIKREEIWLSDHYEFIFSPPPSGECLAHNRPRAAQRMSEGNSWPRWLVSSVASSITHIDSKNAHSRCGRFTKPDFFDWTINESEKIFATKRTARKLFGEERVLISERRQKTMRSMRSIKRMGSSSEKWLQLKRLEWEWIESREKLAEKTAIESINQVFIVKGRDSWWFL